MSETHLEDQLLDKLQEFLLELGHGFCFEAEAKTPFLSAIRIILLIWSSTTASNFAMVQAYWNIGRIIVEEEQKGKTKADYGKQLIAELAKRLKADFGKGFDQSNLWHMRSFYLAFPILDAVRRELTWTHYPVAAESGTTGGPPILL